MAVLLEKPIPRQCQCVMIKQMSQTTPRGIQRSREGSTGQAFTPSPLHHRPHFTAPIETTMIRLRSDKASCKWKDLEQGQDDSEFKSLTDDTWSKIAFCFLRKVFLKSIASLIEEPQCNFFRALLVLGKTFSFLSDHSNVFCGCEVGERLKLGYISQSGFLFLFKIRENQVHVHL